MVDKSPDGSYAESDPNVRAAAALAVARNATPDDARALDLCAQTDVSVSVASRCRTQGGPPPSRSRPVLVYVFPDGANAPRPGAAYALLFADGTLREGATDRRGAVFDPAAPEGSIRLVAPQPGP